MTNSFTNNVIVILLCPLPREIASNIILRWRQRHAQFISDTESLFGTRQFQIVYRYNSGCHEFVRCVADNYIDVAADNLSFNVPLRACRSHLYNESLTVVRSCTIDWYAEAQSRLQARNFSNCFRCFRNFLIQYSKKIFAWNSHLLLKYSFIYATCYICYSDDKFRIER